MSEKLKQNILATIIYYDGLKYPLTAFEVWKYLVRADYYTPTDQPDVCLREVIEKLDSPELAIHIAQKNGFYFLKGQDYLVSRRIANGKISTQKIKKLRRIVWLLRFVPFVRMVGITGGLAMKNAGSQSDWDLLIVLEQGKIWTGRTLVTAILHLMGKRRHGKKIANRVCLNFFVTTSSLEVITKDLFSASEYMFLFPLFGWKTFLRFQMKNHWIKSMKQNYNLSEIQHLKTLEDSIWSRNIRKFCESILAFEFIENFLSVVEKNRIMKNPKTKQEGSLIYANNDALIFLPSPHGPKLFENFKKKIQQFGD